ncbi:MAG: hypothetical protein HN846_02675 [Candidatus Pacebacteria bacterium]|jgi:hypothetical protein|nr:hypothetical protein [Candidatus Paceibacterota bacterium]MBT3511766.1 hypothetical protein [Candidatus Paceibacterota bacterium]MBT4005191.1 hypothetical protein [Candidatus Paceibacterota bacterium]MBT4359017.1 hypothetical protein [Candidatus Paceibacterota bacterium]MBT4681292.1 hypothetical protein [Candidatus Paceibacterota bacterium]
MNESGDEKHEFKPITIDHLSEFQKSLLKEGLFGLWNFIIFSIELRRDYGHETEVIPYQTEGIIGFFDQHMGDVVETLEIFYLSRIPVELISKMIELSTDKKIDPRLKIGVSMLFSMIVTSHLELNGFSVVGEIPDLFGILLAGIWASVGYLAIEYLFSDKNNIAETLSSSKKNVKLKNLIRKMFIPPDKEN